jgi:rhodanese-related sulfurtransferase
VSNDDNIEIGAAEAQRRFDGGEVQIVDVREDAEWDHSHIPGDVTHIPLGELTQRAGELGGDKPIVFQCRSGVRSLMAAQAFRAAGREAYSLEGGLVAWDAEGLPVEPEGAGVAAH